MDEHPNYSLAEAELDDRVRRWYDAQEPSSEMFEAVREACEASAVEVHVAPTPLRLARWLGHHAWLLAACLLLAAAVVFTIYAGDDSTNVAAKLARAHHGDVSYVVADYADVATVIPELGFDPVAPTHERAIQLDLLGAGYCSIDGKKVVEMRLCDAEGSVYSLYEFRAAADLDVSEGTFVIDGVEVCVWVQDELVCGLARRVEE